MMQLCSSTLLQCETHPSFFRRVWKPLPTWVIPEQCFCQTVAIFVERLFQDSSCLHKRQTYAILIHTSTWVACMLVTLLRSLHSLKIRLCSVQWHCNHRNQGCAAQLNLKTNGKTFLVQFRLDYYETTLSESYMNY